MGCSSRFDCLVLTRAVDREEPVKSVEVTMNVRAVAADGQVRVGRANDPRLRRRNDEFADVA